MTNTRERLTGALRKHPTAQLQNWETKLRCECGLHDLTTKLEWAEHIADVLLSFPVVIVDDSLLERLDDALEDVLNKHYTLPDYECSCGKINNMDGDVLHAHRLGALSKAVELVLLTAAAQPVSK